MELHLKRIFSYKCWRKSNIGCCTHVRLNIFDSLMFKYLFIDGMKRQRMVEHRTCGEGGEGVDWWRWAGGMEVNRKRGERRVCSQS